MALRRSLSVAVGPLARGSNQLVTLALTLVAMRYLDPTQFGTFSIAAIATTVIRTLLYTGAFEYLLKAKSAREGASEALVANLSIVTVLSAVVAAVALIARSFDANAAIVSLLLILIPSNFIAAIGAWQESLLLRNTRLALYYAMTFTAELVSMLVAIALFADGFGLLALVGQVYTRNGLLILLYALVERPILSMRFSGAKLGEVLRWSVPRYGSTVLVMTSTYAVDLLLGIFLSPAATGIYRASSRLVTAVADIFNQPTRIMGMTMISKRVAMNQPAAILWTLIFALAAVFGWSALAGLGGVASFLVPALMGADWVAAVPIVAILCATRAFSLFDAAMTPALVAHNHQKSMFYVQIGSALVLLSLVVLASPYGVVAATVASVGAAAVNSALVYNLARRRLPGSGASLRQHAIVAVLPALATLSGTMVVTIGFADLGLDPIVLIAAAVAAGLSAWAICLLILQRRIRAIVFALRDSEPLR